MLPSWCSAASYDWMGQRYVCSGSGRSLPSLAISNHYCVKPSKRGRNRAISGMNATNSSVTTMAAKNGSSGFISLSIGSPLIAMPTNRQSPPAA